MGKSFIVKGITDSNGDTRPDYDLEADVGGDSSAREIDLGNGSWRVEIVSWDKTDGEITSSMANAKGFEKSDAAIPRKSKRTAPDGTVTERG